MVNIEYANAYSEVLEILKYISDDDYKKIPQSKIDVFKVNSNKEYKFNYDPEKTLEEQNVSKRARAIIGLLFRDYWATDVQRDKIKRKQENDRAVIEEENRKRYNSDKLFKKNNKKEENRIEERNVELVIYKESFIKKCINKMKEFLKIK